MADEKMCENFEKDWSSGDAPKKVREITIRFKPRQVIKKIAQGLTIGVILLVVVAGLALLITDLTLFRNECDVIEDVVITDIQIEKEWTYYGKILFHVKFKCNSSITTDWIFIDDINLSHEASFPEIYIGIHLRFYWIKSSNGYLLQFADVI